MTWERVADAAISAHVAQDVYGADEIVVRAEDLRAILSFSSRPSQRLRGRASAFDQDRLHVAKLIDSYSGEDNDRRLLDMRDRNRAYKILSDELCMLADELAREGL